LFLQSPLKLILASTSTYRRELLGRIYPAFECAAPGIDETPLPQESGAGLVRRLVLAKAQAVARRHPQAWVIGSDQAAVLTQGQAPPAILGKPGSAQNCVRQLQACSGRHVEYLTACAVVREGHPQAHEFLDTTRVAFRALGDAEIERYVAREAPFDCAGGFKSEALGISLCESIETRDPTALIGLPLIRLSAVLRAIGFAVP
jgi:7-methyl-GTP pyrophosphatase